MEFPTVLAVDTPDDLVLVVLGERGSPIDIVGMITPSDLDSMIEAKLSC